MAFENKPLRLTPRIVKFKPQSPLWGVGQVPHPLFHLQDHDALNSLDGGALRLKQHSQKVRTEPLRPREDAPAA